MDSESDNSGTLLEVRFTVKGNVIYLSHSETVRVFHRALVRAGVKMRYSRGFNPRPKLSLPLPRSVGVGSEDELLCLGIEESAELFDGERFKDEVGRQMPEGFEIICVEAIKRAPVAEGAIYILTARPEYVNEELKGRIKELLSSESLCIERRVDAKGNIKNIDVRSFLNRIELKGTEVTVESKITPGGSVRVDEIQELLGLGTEQLAAPIRRVKIQWQNRN